MAEDVQRREQANRAAQRAKLRAEQEAAHRARLEEERQLKVSILADERSYLHEIALPPVRD